MESKIKKLSEVQVNKKNPRTISDSKFQKLINSLLSLPKMLEIRPVAIDAKGVALGGNMRLRALTTIAGMSMEEIRKRLSSSRDVKKKSEKEQEALAAYWEKWLAAPVVHTVDASSLTKEEQREFIIKDNGDFGQWDYDALANEWNADELNDWGVDVWQTKEVENVFSGGGSANADKILANEEDPEGTGQLPAELQGVDLAPEQLPKIQGADETAFERIIIVYPKERKEELLGLLGMQEITKVVYHLDEIVPGADPADGEA